MAFTYNGSPNAPINIGTYVVIGTVVDNNYFGGATNNLVIALNNTPTNITTSVSGNQLTIAWPADQIGWVLQANLNLSNPTGWMDVPGSDTNSQWIMTIDSSIPTVFFRLRLPPPPVPPPTNPQTFDSGSTNSIGFGWTASPDPGVTGYRVFYGTTSNSLTNSIDVGDVTSTIISGLTPGQTLFLRRGRPQRRKPESDECQHFRPDRCQREHRPAIQRSYDTPNRIRSAIHRPGSSPGSPTVRARGTLVRVSSCCTTLTSLSIGSSA